MLGEGEDVGTEIQDCHIQAESSDVKSGLSFFQLLFFGRKDSTPSDAQGSVIPGSLLARVGGTL